MNKVTSYLKNVGKSVSYATVDVITSNLIPDVHDFTETNKDIFKSVYSTVTHSRRAMKYGKKMAADNQIYKDLNKGFNNALDDIKSGNIYNKAREEQGYVDAAENMFSGDDFDFGFDWEDDDGSLDDFQDEVPSKEASVSKGDLIISDSITKSGNLSAQLISKTVANTSNILAKTNIATTNMILAQNVELISGVRTSIAGVHESINSILKFANDKIVTQINNESKYFETTTTLMQENNAILKEMLEMQRNLYKKQQASKSNDQMSDIFSGGTFDVKGYAKAISKNLAKTIDPTGMLSMATSDIGGESLLSQSFTNPLGSIMTGLVKSFMPKEVAKSVFNFNKTLGSIFPVMIAKLNKWKKNKSGTLLGLLGGIFGLDTDTKKSIDTSKYNKEAVPFDGITRKAIVDVIPEHLSRIESLLAGNEQRTYDYQTGKWISAKDIKKKQQEDYDYMVKDSFSEMFGDMRTFMSEIQKQQSLTTESMKSLQDDMIKMMRQSFEEGLLSPKNNIKNIKNFKFSNEDIMKIFFEYIDKNMPSYKIASVAKNAADNKRRYGNIMRDAEIQGDHIYRKTADGSYAGYEPGSGIGGYGSSRNNRNRQKIVNSGISRSNDIKNDESVLNALFKSNIENDEAEELFKGYGKVYDNKWTEGMKAIPGDTFVEKFRNAKGIKQKFAVISGSLNDIAKKPTALLTGLVDKADHAIYNMLFKAETDEFDADGKKISGLFNLMVQKMRTSWLELTENLNQNVIKPLADKLFGEGAYDKFKERAKEGLFGRVQRDENDNVIKNKYGFAKRSNGVFTPFMTAVQKNYRGAEKYTKDSIKDVMSPVTDSNFVKDIKIASLNKKLNKNQKELDKYKDDFDFLKANVEAKNNGTLKEIVKYAMIKSKLQKLGFDVSMFAKGGVDEGTGTSGNPKIAIYSDNEDVIVHNNNNPKQTKENEKKEHDLVKKLEKENILYKEQIEELENSKKENGTGFDKILDETKKGFSQFGDTINKFMGVEGDTKEEQDKSIKKQQSSFMNYASKIFGELKGEGFADIGGKAVIGGGLGLLLGGPLLGAVIGAGTGLIKNSETISKFVFGEDITEDGKTTHKEGLISKKVQDTFNKYIPDMGKYGVTGAVASLITPFGPLAGAAIGAGIGLVKKSDTLSNMLFGDDDGLFNKQRKDKIKEYLPKALAGAAVGLVTGPFGFLGNAVLGAGAGMLTGTEEFKDLIFGEPGPNGTRFGGVKGALDDYFVKPIREFGNNFKEDFFGFIKESMIDPLNSAITPIANEIAYQTKRVVFGIPKMFAKLGKDYIGIPFMKLMESYFARPLGDLTKRLFGGAINKVKGVVSLPFRAVGAVGDHLRKKQIRQGRDVAGTAKDRIQFADSRKMGNYQYRAFDEALADNADNTDYLEEITARTGMLAHGAEYFETQVQQTGKELSKVLAAYVDLGWLTKGKDEHKRITNYIKNNDVESAIQELSQIQKSRTDGGRMSDENADEAIRRFTDANREYQATKKAREAFGNLNKEENAAWMENEFGKDWEKLDMKRLFKYSTKELAHATGEKEKTKQDLFNDPTQLVTKGDEQINGTLQRIEELIKQVNARIFPDSEDAKKYNEEVLKGAEEAKAKRSAQKINIKTRLSSKGLDYEDDIISLLYSNEKVLNLVLYVSSEYNINYDMDIVRKLCEAELNDEDITLIEKYPYIALLPENILKKYISKYRNNRGSLFSNKKIRDKNLKQLNYAMSKGILVNDEKDAQMITSGGSVDKYDHKLRSDYFDKLNKMGLIGKTVDINGKEQELTQKMIIDPKGLSYEDMNKLIESNGETADILEPRKGNIRAGLHNFSDKHLGGVRKLGGKALKLGALGGLGLITAPITLPTAALAATGIGLAKGGSFIGKNLNELKNLGLGGFINNKKIKAGINSDFNTDFDSNPSNDLEQKVKYTTTDYGRIKWIRDDSNEWTEDKSDAETKETLEKQKEATDQKKGFMDTMKSMKDGLFGWFKRSEEKDSKDKDKEPWYKKIFDTEIGSKIKFGAAILAGVTGIGAIKSAWDNEGEGGIMHKLADKIGSFVGPYVDKVRNWFMSEEEYAGAGFKESASNLIETYIIPNVAKGMNVIFGTIAPALIKALFANLPALIKAGVDGIKEAIFGIGGTEGHDDAVQKVGKDAVKNSNVNKGDATGDWLTNAVKDASSVGTYIESIKYDYNTNRLNTSGDLSSVFGVNNQGNDSSTNNQNNNSNTQGNNNQSTNNQNNNTQTDTRSEEELNGPVTITLDGVDVYMYKKDKNGKLSYVTLKEWENGNVLEWYTEGGRRYTWSESENSYVLDPSADQGDGREKDGSLPGRIFRSGVRSALTGRAPLALKDMGKFSRKLGKMLGKLPLVNKYLSNGGGKIAGGIFDIADNVNRAGVYASKSLNRAMSNVGKETAEQAGKNVAKEAGEKAAEQTAKTIAKGTGKEVAEGTGKAVAKDLAKETAKKGGKKKGIIGKIISKIGEWLNKGLSHSSIYNKLKEAFVSKKKKLSDKQIKQKIKDLIDNLCDKIASKLSSKGATLLTNILKNLNAIATVLYVVADVTVAWDQADSILGVQNTTFREKVIAIIVNLLSNRLFGGIIDANTIFSWTKGIFLTIFGIDKNEFAKREQDANEARKKWNIEHKDSKLSTEEFLKKDDWTWKATQAWDGVKDWGSEKLNQAKDFISDLNPFKKSSDKITEKAKEKKEGKSGSNKNNSSWLSNVFGQTTEASEKVSKNQKELNENYSDTDAVTNTADLSSTSLSDQQLNYFETMSDNIGSATSIMDFRLGKAYGFTDSSGKFIPLSEAIEKYDPSKINKKGKGEYTFSDVLSAMNSTFKNLTGAVNISQGSLGLSGNTTTTSNKSGGFFSSAFSKVGSTFSSIFGGSGTGPKNSGFVSQMDPKFKNKRFNIAGDTDIQTLGDSGCAPATAANVLNIYSGRGSEMISASEAALRYKDTDGGVTPDYFTNYLGKNGINTYSTMNKNEMLSGINSGQPTILLGADPTNRANTPYNANSSHYVVATGTDGRGNTIVQDPESRRPNALYPTKDLLNQSMYGMVTGRGSGRNTIPSLRSRLGRFGFGKGPGGVAGLLNTVVSAGASAGLTGDTINQDLATFSELTDSQIDTFIKKKRKDSPFTGAIINKASKASGLDPRYILAHAAIESAWGTSTYAKAGNFFGIGAFDSNPDNAYKYSNSSMESGLINGAVWIRTNYYDKGQKTLYTMRYNNGEHEYCTSNTWAKDIASIMDQMPENTNVQYHPSDGSISTDSSSSTASDIFSQLATLPASYFGPKLMSLFGFDSSSSGVNVNSNGTASVAAVEAATKQMEDWANDPAHGYDQTNRWGEKGDYDCSGAVISAYQNAGIPVKDNGASYTGNMLSTFLKTGFTDVTSKVDLKTGSGLERGDVLLTPSKHTAMYAGNNKEVEASINENGRATGGKPGDQTGKEFLIKDYKNHPWKNILRYTGNGGGVKNKHPKYLSGRGGSTVSNMISNYGQQISLPSSSSQNIIRNSSYLPSLNSYTNTTGMESSGILNSTNDSKVEKLLSVIIEVLSVIANNSEKLSEIVSLLSKALDLNLTENDISQLSSNNAQIKNKIANALKTQGSSTGMGNSIMNSSTESLANAMYSIARA